MRQNSFVKEGILAGMPIFIGYFPAAMAFGLLAKTSHINFGESLLFSVFVFAGASQFMALNLLNSGIAITEIIIATFLLNLRHLLMSASLATRVQCRLKDLPMIAFGVTDETFSVAVTHTGQLNTKFLLMLELTAYTGWVSGTIAGYLIGSTLPSALQTSMEIVLYALFVSIIIPEAKKTFQYGMMAVIAGALHLSLVYMKWLPSGWNLITAVLISTAIGAYWFRPDNPKEVNQ